MKKFQRSMSIILLLAMIFTSLVHFAVPQPVMAQGSVLFEDFENGSKSSYAAADVDLSSGSWYFDNALIGSLANDKKNDSNSVRIRAAGSIAMNFDVPGASSVSFYHANYGTDTGGQITLQKSLDSGTNWVDVAGPFASSSVLTEETFDMNEPGDVRFRILVTGTSGKRINIDDFSVDPFTDGGDTQLEIVYPNPVVEAEANSTVTVSFFVNNEGDSVTARVYSKVVSAEEYSVQQAVYAADSGLYSGFIDIDTENVHYYIEASDSSGTTAETPVYEIKIPSGVLTIAEAREKALDEVVTVEGIVTSTNTIFIQDDTAGICLYSQNGSIPLEQGDKVRVTGKLISYNNLLEISPFTVDEVISKGNELQEPHILTINQIGEAYEGQLIKLEKVTLGQINTSVNTPIKDESNNTINIYKIPALDGIFEGDTVDVIAIVSQYKTDYQLHVRSADDVTISQSVPVSVEPVFYTTPANMTTTYEARPEISVLYEEGEKSLVPDSARLELDGTLVEAEKVFDDQAKKGSVTFNPTEDLNVGEHEVRFTIKDEEDTEYEKIWYFTILESKDDFNIYFGVPHAHTSFSDGQGTPAEAFEYAYDQNLDFLIITDHSNWLEGDYFDSGNNQYTPVDGSEWVRTKEMADAFNSSYAGEFLAMRGFEWTHSSIGHMNAYNSVNYTEAKQTMTELADFYDWLGKEKVVAAFNHPNWPSDSFNNLAYDEDADRWVKMIEVGNGAPPYSYSRSIEHYYKALDNGWHVGAVNAQDNHAMNWGDPDNLTGVLAEDLTVESFTEAFKAHRVYSTETRNLVLRMKANDFWMGSILKLEDDEKLSFDIFAGDDDDAIQKLELVTNGGNVVDSLDVNDYTASWSPELTPGSGNHWYVVKVTHTNGKIGMSSPIWTAGAENDVKLTELVVEPQPALPGHKSDILASVANFGVKAVENVEVKFYHTSVSESNLIGTALIDRIAADEKRTAHVNWTPSDSGEVKIIAKLTEIPGVTTVTELSKTVLVVTPNHKSILIDQFHGNADVPGTVGNFVKLLRTYGYGAEFNTQAITAEVLANTDVLVLGAPAESKTLSADEDKAIADWVKAGGALLIANKSNYSFNNQLLNSTLEELNSGMRFSNDNVYEPEDSDKYSGGMVWSIYMETFPEASGGLNKNMKSLRIFSGCALVDENYGALTNDDTTKLEMLLAANKTSYNYNPIAGSSHVYNLEGQNNGDTIPVIAKEEIENGRVVAAGRHFYSDFEVVNDASNTAFAINIIDWLAGYDRIKDIAWVRENAQPGIPYTVRGTITTPTNLFYDSMYIQDATGGICLYGDQKAEFRGGEEVIATGVVKEFEGEIELAYQDFTYDVLYTGPAQEIKAQNIATKDVADGSHAGKLVKTSGNITEINELVGYFTINDGSGEAYIHVDGYLGIDMKALKTGDAVAVTGIASYGAAGPRIRLRYNGDISFTGVTGAKIAVFSDPHYFAPELGTQGAAFEAYLVQDRKLIAESKAITEAVVDKITDSDVDIVLIPGDLTKDGEKLSHEQFADLIGKMKDAGKKVYVTAGNHDINNPQANSYSGAQAIPVDNVTPVQFEEIYNDFGYGEAIAKDPNSLAYVVEPVPGLWIIAMDACLYDDNDGRAHSVTAGAFSEERLDWIKEQLGKAKGKTVIGFMHHGIIEHFSSQTQLFGEYVIDNLEEVSTQLADMGMKAVFTGHYHANDMVKKTTQAGNTIYDIETGSLVTYPSPYRMVDISDGKMTVKTSFVQEIDYDTGNDTFQEYARNYLVEGLNGLIPYMLAEQLMAMNPQFTEAQALQQALQMADLQPAPEVITMTVRELIVDAMVSHYKGDEKASPQVLAVVQGMAGSSDPMSALLGAFLTGLYTDPEPGDTGVAIDLSTGAYTGLNSCTDLSDIKINGSSLTDFDPQKQEYTVNVGNSVKSITVTASLADSSGSLVINRKPAASGEASDDISLSTGSNNVRIVVTAQDGTQKIYVLTVNRELSTGGDSDRDRGGPGTQPGTETSSEENGIIKLPAPEVDSNGAAVADVDQKSMDKAIQNSENKKVMIDVPNAAGASKVLTKLPAASLQNAKESNIESIEIRTGLASILVAPDALDDYRTSSSESIELSVEKIDSGDLPEDVQEKMKGKPIYDFNVSVDGQQVHGFNGNNPVQITVPYLLDSGENPDNIVVFYINDSVKPPVLEEVPGIYDAETGRVTFRVSHFSKYSAMHVRISFADIEEAVWAKTDIEALAARKIIAGMGENRFAPNANITRAQFIQMLISTFGLMDESAVTSFKDVKPGDWYYNAVATAQKLGITSGVGDGTFGVDRQITCQEMAVMASRTAAIVKLKLPKKTQAMEFTDGQMIASYAKDAVAEMQQAGIINGVGYNRFAPTDHATRAQAAKILYELYKLHNKSAASN